MQPSQTLISVNWKIHNKMGFILSICVNEKFVCLSLLRLIKFSTKPFNRCLLMFGSCMGTDMSDFEQLLDGLGVFTEGRKEDS